MQGSAITQGNAWGSIFGVITSNSCNEAPDITFNYFRGLICVMLSAGCVLGTLSFLSLVFGFCQGKTSNSPRIFCSHRTHEILGKYRENPLNFKQGMSLLKMNQGNPNNQGKEGQRSKAITPQKCFWEISCSVATQRFCYRGPKPQKGPKWLAQGAKRVLGPGSKGLPRVFCTTETLFCTGATLFCTSARGLWHPWPKRPCAPSPNHFGHF